MDSLQSNSDESNLPARPAPRINPERARYVVIDCLDAGNTRLEIREKLMAYGYSEIDADRFIETVEREQRNTRAYDDEFRGDARFLTRCGGGLLLLGIGIIVGCIVAAFYDVEVIKYPLWFAGIFIGGAINGIGARLFWRGFW